MDDEKMQKELMRVEGQINEIQSMLQKFPKEDFFCSKNGKYYKWYATDGKTQKYIPKSKRFLAEKLAMKRYLSCMLEDCIQKKKFMELYLEKMKKQESKAEKLLLQAPEYQELISTYFKPVSKELLEWANAPFNSNPKYPEQLIHKAFSGKYVRSKSEAMIDMFLHMKNIPFRYEAELILEEITIYPDFTIRHPKTGAYFYWEHFGMVDVPEYCQKMIGKLRTYTSCGIVPGVQLITTYETRRHPLNVELVEKIIEYYFV